MKYSGKIDSLKILLFHDLSDTYYHIEQRVKYRFQLSSFDLTLRWIDARCTYMLCNVTLLSSFSGNCFLLKMHLAAFPCSYGYLSPKDLWIVKLTSVADLVKRLDKKKERILNDQPFLKSCEPAVRGSCETWRQLQHGRPGRESNLYPKTSP